METFNSHQLDLNFPFSFSISLLCISLFYFINLFYFLCKLKHIRPKKLFVVVVEKGTVTMPIICLLPFILLINPFEGAHRVLHTFSSFFETLRLIFFTFVFLYNSFAIQGLNFS